MTKKDGKTTWKLIQKTVEDSNEKSEKTDDLEETLLDSESPADGKLGINESYQEEEESK